MRHPTFAPKFKQQSPPTTPTVHQLQTPTLLGHPHEEALPQETEPFWQQQPENAYPHARYYPELDLYTDRPVYCLPSNIMEVSHVVIGHRSRYARATEHAKKPQRPREMVHVYLGDEFVGECPFGVLVRFSRLASETWPKPTQSVKGSEKVEESVKAEVQTGEHGASVKAPSTGKEWAEMAEQSDADRVDKSPYPKANIAASAQNAQPTAVGTAHLPPQGVRTKAVASPQTPSQNAASVACTEPPPPKELTIGVDGAWVQPDVSVVKYILHWMHKNKDTRNNKPLLPLIPTSLNEIPLKSLIDLFTGVLAYGLAPHPKEIHVEIMARITNHPVKVEQICYIYERIPLRHFILTRMVTSYFEHLEKDHYTQEDIGAIHKYVREVQDGGNLKRQFGRVEESRKDASKAKELKEEFNPLMKPMEKLTVVDVEGLSKGEPSKVEAPKFNAPKNGAPKNTALKHEGVVYLRRNMREQQQSKNTQVQAKPNEACQGKAS
jgi:hypothetical protein